MLTGHGSAQNAQPHEESGVDPVILQHLSESAVGCDCFFDRRVGHNEHYKKQIGGDAVGGHQWDKDEYGRWEIAAGLCRETRTSGPR